MLLSRSINRPVRPTGSSRPSHIKPHSALAAAIVGAAMVFSLAGRAQATPVVFGGFEHNSLGTASISPTSDGRKLIVSNIGSSGQDGVEIKWRSVRGAGVTIISNPTPNTPGAVLTKRYKGWDGTIKGVRRTETGSTGLTTHTFDYSGIGATSVTVVLQDAFGNAVSTATTAGPLATVPTPPACQPGSQWGYAKWYDIWDGGTHYLGWFCSDPIHPIWRVAVTPNFAPGTSPDVAIDSIAVTGRNIGELQLAPPSAPFGQGLVTGLGQVLLDETCDAGQPCTDPSTRRLPVRNIGSSGQDGVEIKWPTVAASNSASFSLGDVLHSTASADIQLKGLLTPSGVESEIGRFHVSGTGSGGVVYPDFSSVGATQFQVIGYNSAGVMTHQETLPNLTPVVLGSDQVVCGPNSVIIWGWVTMWVWNQPYPYAGGSYQTYWGVVGCLQLGGGTGGGSPTYLDRIAFVPVNPAPVHGTTGATITASNLPAPITLTSLSTQPVPQPCAAGGMHEDFDKLVVGPIDNAPCWSQFAGLTDVSGMVSSGTGIGGSNSLRLQGAPNADGIGDTIVRSVSISGGRATFTSSLKVPSSATGNGFLALMDQYPDPLHFGAWLVVDASSGSVRNVMNNAQSVPLIRDAWAPIRIECDLDSNTVAAYYNNQVIFSGQNWQTGTGFPGSPPVGLPQISGILLYAGDGGTSGITVMDFDDMSLLPASAPACLADVSGDGTVDGGDFVAFINSFAIGDTTIDATADVNADGTIDGGDFVAFINAFALGC